MKSGTIRRLPPPLRLALVLLVFFGCEKDTIVPCELEVPAGRIEGVVRVGEVWLDAYVVATRIPNPGQNSAIIRTQVNPATGAYSIDVPAGRYVVGLAFREQAPVVYEYSVEGLRFGDLPPDTLSVEDWTDPVRVDFDLGTVTARLALSPGLDGEYAYVQLHRRNAPQTTLSRSYVSGGGAEIKEGKATIGIVGVLPGDYKAEIILGRRHYRCSCPWDGEHLWVPGTRDSSNTPWISVGVGEVVRLNAAIDPIPARIEGRISGAWLRMGARNDPNFALVGLDSSVVIGHRSVAEDGTFQADIYLPEPVKVLVEQEGLEHWIGGRSFEDASIFTLRRGESVTIPEFAQSGLRLHVARPGVSSFDIKVELYDAGSRSWIGTWSPYTSNPGDPLRICNLVPGEYLLRLRPWSSFWGRWLAQWYDRASDPDGAQTVVISAEDQIVDLQVTIERGGGILGAILDREGSADDFLLFVTPSGDPTGHLAAWAHSPKREFEIYGLPDGEWKIGAWRQVEGAEYPDDPPAGTIWYPGTRDWSQAASITIAGASVVSGIEIPGIIGAGSAVLLDLEPAR